MWCFEKPLAGLVVCALTLPLAGCPAFHSVDRDVERTPVVNTGAGASIIYPGQSPPAHPGNQHPRATPPGGGQQSSSSGPTESSQRSGSGAPGGAGGVTMIGGSAVEEERHQKIEESPRYWKYVTLPFAIVAAPFAYVYDAVKGEPEAGPEVPTASSQQQRNAPPAGPPPVDYETRQLEEMERELAERAGPSPAPSPTPVRRPPSAVPRSQGAPTHSGGGFSIAEELAALQGGSEAERAGTQPEYTGATAPAPRQVASVDPLAAASGHVDRDGDGRIDHWIFRDRGQISRELFDEDFDGAPDRTLHYDLASHQVARIEEDNNRDGRADTWTALREGRVVGRRADANEDGQIDTWTFYREGVVTRIERDASGNGFRDHVAHYESGKLSREEKDDDGDGIPDLITHYDAQERVARVEEDANGDGHLDVVSHYEGGRLKSREVMDASLLDNGATR
jgi:hypothetical protein